MGQTGLGALIRRVLQRLRSGVGIPGSGIQIAIDIRRARHGSPTVSSDNVETSQNSVDKHLADVALKIVVGHNRAVMKKIPALQRFHRPEFDTDIAFASAFLNFLNEALVLFHPDARGVHLRRQLVRLKEHLVDETARAAVDREIAISDLEDGVIERALQLVGDPVHGAKAISDKQAFDVHYGAVPPFLSVAREAIDFSKDVRGNSLLWYLKRNTEIFEGKRILHVAPEWAVENFFRSKAERPPLRYETLDGFSSTVDHLQDLTDIDFPDDAFDLIICHRVLEHIVDDTGAMASMYRVLAPGGILDISVPQSMNLETTNEWVAQDTSHHDHVRQYGRDFVDRLMSVGFLVEVDQQLLEKSLGAHQEDGSYPMRHYICRKAAHGSSPAEGMQAVSS